jgi:hypothetical protein
MKFKFLAFAVCIAALSTVGIEAKDIFSKKANNLLSKDKSSIIFFGAEDTSLITLVGTTTSAYTPLTFTQDQLSNGITTDVTSSQFLLKEGTYKISFAGTFQSGFPPSFYNIALQVGSHIIFINTDSLEFFPFDSFGISTIYKVIEVDKATTLSIVARNTTPGATVALTTRSITIQKL